VGGSQLSARERERRRQRLLQLMEAHGLSPDDVAGMLSVSRHTVDAWAKPATSRSANPVPVMALELLERKAEE
jgi:transposase